MSKKVTYIFLLLFNFGFSQSNLPLIPKPKELKIEKGSFMLSNKTVIIADEKSFEAKYLQSIIKEQLGLELMISSSSKSNSKIIFSLKVIEVERDYKEWYNLFISKKQILIKASESHGAFYGVQTLIQLLPLEKTTVIKLPCLNIIDEPKYQWRGMHLDVGRHFFPTAFIKKYIDYLAMYKMNVFHWHLTEDQGWRIEIKKYPKLTGIGAWRKGSMVGHYIEQKFDNKEYGGFYSQKEIKEIVAYAKQRHITIIPEIEMPGHSQAALATYPEFSCTGGPFEVAMQWGVLEDIYCPKEETFQFLENILTEVLELFPSEYIHIGGDESPKTRWKNCPHCQALIKKEGLKDEHELQSYFIQRIEKFVNSKGRKIIGWDEILEGGLAPNAAVMSWRGTEGGIAAAKQKHFVVMTPGSHCYFDHYQGNPKSEPLAIGGYTTVEKVYSFEPTPKELSVEDSKYILGAQANVWTEYIEDSKKVEYMIFPRIMALSEVLWGTSNPNEYKEFQNRMIQQFPVLDKRNINYSKAIFEVTSSVTPSKKESGILVSLKSANNTNNIKYTMDGSLPTNTSLSYINPILISENKIIKAAYFEEKKQIISQMEQSFLVNKATGKKITLVNQPHENYSAGGSFTLVDGMIGDRGKIGPDWLGFWGKDMIATIDLGKLEQINKVTIGVLSSVGSWIHYPKTIEILISDDGKNFQSIKQISMEEINTMKGEININCSSKKAQFIKIIALNAGKIPDGMAGAGSDSWLFVDEIGIE